MKERAVYIVASFVVGLVLCFCAMIMTGAGHGTYIPLGLCASPTMLLVMLSRGSGLAFFVGLGLAPLYWVLTASVVTGHSDNRRLCAGLLLAAQYVGGPLLYAWSGENADSFLRVASAMPEITAAFFTVFVAAHVILWRSAIVADSQPTPSSV